MYKEHTSHPPDSNNSSTAPAIITKPAFHIKKIYSLSHLSKTSLQKIADMKFLAILALAAAAATAAPNDVTMNIRAPQCKPPQYACKHDNSGWLVCNVDGTWLVSLERKPPFFLLFLLLKRRRVGLSAKCSILTMLSVIRTLAYALRRLLASLSTTCLTAFESSVEVWGSWVICCFLIFTWRGEV